MGDSTSTIRQGEQGFPARLRGLADAPERLFVRGTLPEAERCVAVVGSRAASGHGVARAHDLARDLAARGVLVMSGGAVGIDAAAHVGALAGCGPTVVVMATGLDAPYPQRHRPLFDEIVRRGGALITSFEQGVPIRRWHFPRRNQILAGLVDAVIVVESSSASGSLYTAEAARRYGRVLGAFPGTHGTDALLGLGAALVESADDVIAALDGAPRRQQIAGPEAGTDEALALAALDATDPRGCDRVAQLAGLAAARAARALCSLELEGLALAVPGGRFLRSALVNVVG